MIEGLKPYPKYKDAELATLGAIPSHWVERRAKYLFREVDERSETGGEEMLSVSHKTGVTPRSQKNVTMFMAESNVGHKLCRPDDVVINTMWAWMAALGVSRHTGLVSPAYGVYRPKTGAPNLLSKYADALLRTEAYRSEYVCRSTGINSSRLRLYPEMFLRIPILVPPPDEQAAIVRFLDHADRQINRYIRTKRKLIALLSEQKQAIIHCAVTRGLHSNVKLKPSGVEWLGDVPEHWELRRLKSLVRRVDQGISPQAESRLADSSSWGVLKSGCVNHGVFKETEHKRLSSSTEFDPALEVQLGDILISRASGSPRLVGSVGRVEKLSYRLILCDKTFRPIFNDAVEHDFMVLAMNGRYYRRQVEQAISGAEGLANNLPLSSLRAFLFATPPKAEQREIVAFVADATASMKHGAGVAGSEIELLGQFKIRLIADVVTGRLDVRDAAAKLPDHTDDEYANPAYDEGGEDDESLPDDDAIAEAAE